MPVPQMNNFTFNHSDQIDQLYTVLDATTIKAKFDSRGKELRDFLIQLASLLNATTDSASGADQIAMTPITETGSNATVQSIIEALITRLKAIQDSASGADLIGATGITGLTGATVQALLEGLNSALQTHKTSSDHDGQYYTETEIQAKVDMTKGAPASVNGVDNAAGDISFVGGTGIIVTPNNVTKEITLTATGEAVPGPHASTHATGGSDPVSPSSIGAVDTSHLTSLGHIPYVNSAGSANVYSVTLPNVTNYVDGLPVCLKINVNATGASTLEVNTLGPKPIKDSFGNDIGPNGLKAGIIYTLRFNGDTGNFILQGKGGGGNATSGDLLSGKTATVDSGPIFGQMSNRGAINYSLKINESYTIPPGYHNGSGMVTQSIPTKGATNYVPWTNNQTIAAGQYLTGNQVILGDSNLIPHSISYGKSIFNVSGTSAIVNGQQAYLDNLIWDTSIPAENVFGYQTLWQGATVTLSGSTFSIRPNSCAGSYSSGATVYTFNSYNLSGYKYLKVWLSTAGAYCSGYIAIGPTQGGYIENWTKYQGTSLGINVMDISGYPANYYINIHVNANNVYDPGTTYFSAVWLEKP